MFVCLVGLLVGWFLSVEYPKDKLRRCGFDPTSRIDCSCPNTTAPSMENILNSWRVLIPNVLRQNRDQTKRKKSQRNMIYAKAFGCFHIFEHTRKYTLVRAVHMLRTN